MLAVDRLLLTCLSAAMNAVVLLEVVEFLALDALHDPLCQSDLAIGLTLDREKAPLEKPEFEEAVVNQLTNVMMGVFRDNAWMVDMLKDQLEKTDQD